MATLTNTNNTAAGWVAYMNIEPFHILATRETEAAAIERALHVGGWAPEKSFISTAPATQRLMDTTKQPKWRIVNGVADIVE